MLSLFLAPKEQEIHSLCNNKGLWTALFWSQERKRTLCLLEDEWKVWYVVALFSCVTFWIAHYYSLFINVLHFDALPWQGSKPQWCQPGLGFPYWDCFSIASPEASAFCLKQLSRMVNGFISLSPKYSQLGEAQLVHVLRQLQQFSIFTYQKIADTLMESQIKDVQRGLRFGKRKYCFRWV